MVAVDAKTRMAIELVLKDLATKNLEALGTLLRAGVEADRSADV